MTDQAQPSIRELIAAKAFREHEDMHHNGLINAIDRLESGLVKTIEAEKQAEADALRNFNLKAKQKRAWSKFTTKGKETMVAVCKAQSAASLLRTMEPKQGKRGGWNQHTFEYLPSLFERLAGNVHPEEDACTSKLWPVVASMASGKPVSRAQFSQAYACGGLNNLGGQFLSFLTMPEKGPALITAHNADGALTTSRIDHYKPTGKLLALLAKLA